MILRQITEIQQKEETGRTHRKIDGEQTMLGCSIQHKRLKFDHNNVKEKTIMSSSNRSNKLVVPNAREAMNKFKMEAANEVGVNLKQGYNGDLSSREAGSVGGQMVKKMIEAYENGLQ